MKHIEAPSITPESDWQEMVLPFNIGSGRTLYAGLEKDSRCRLRVFKKGANLVGRVWFGAGADGPPLHVHGGASAYILDEAMGSVAWMNGFPVMAKKLEFQYLRPTPLQIDLHVTAQVTKQDAKKLMVESALTLPSGETCVSGRGEFAILSQAKMKALFADKFDPQGILKKMNLKWAPDDQN